MELITSRLILFAFIVVFCNGINPTTILNLGGSYYKILSEHGYEVLKVKTLEHCHRICLYSSKCLSVNWNVKTKFCQLNSEAVGTEAPQMMSREELYVSAQGSNLKNNACTPSPCKFGEVCIPVKSATDFVCLLPDDQVSATTASAPAMTPATTMTTLVTTTSTTMLTTTIPTTPASTMTHSIDETRTTTTTTTATMTTLTTTSTTMLTTTIPTTPTSMMTTLLLTTTQMTDETKTATTTTTATMTTTMLTTTIPATTTVNTTMTTSVTTTSTTSLTTTPTNPTSTITTLLLTTTPTAETGTTTTATTTMVTMTLASTTSTTPKTSTATTTTTTTTTVTKTLDMSTTTTTTTTTTPDCSTYSNEFTRIEGYAVWNHNNRTISDVRSASTCKQHCVQYTTFTCKSCEYYYAWKYCFLQSFVKDDALTAWAADSRADYFERLRQCDVTPDHP